MAEIRKKVIAYLHPELYEQDALAADFIAKLPSSLRGEFYRQSLVTGAALTSIDPRLLQIISIMYSERFDESALMGIISGIIRQDSFQSTEKLSKDHNDEISRQKNIALTNLKKFKR